MMNSVAVTSSIQLKVKEQLVKETPKKTSIFLEGTEMLHAGNKLQTN